MHEGSTSPGGPVPALARQGRHKQRYAPTGERLVAGCIPVRVHSNGGQVAAVDVCLISSRAGKGFCFPKGGWEDDETQAEAAKRETVEEAGVRGQLEEPAIGIFHFQSGKPSAHEASQHQGRCIAHMYVMHVEEELAVWPEGHERQRVWCPLVEAASKCRHEWMRDALMMWVRRHGWEHLLPAASSDAKSTLQTVNSNGPSTSARLCATATTSATSASLSDNSLGEAEVTLGRSSYQS